MKVKIFTTGMNHLEEQMNDFLKDVIFYGMSCSMYKIIIWYEDKAEDKS